MKETTPKENLDKVRFSLGVAAIQAETNGLEGQRKIAIVMNANSVDEATEIDYLITNKQGEQVTGEWMVKTFSTRNYIEKFYREALMLVRLKRVPNKKKRKFNSSLYSSFYSLYFHYLSAINGGTLENVMPINL